MAPDQITSGRLCEAAILAFDRLCVLEQGRADGAAELTPRQRSRRSLLAARAAAGEWIVPAELAATVTELIAAADRIEDPTLAAAWTDHLPIAVLSCLERRSLARRLLDRDPMLVTG